MRILVVIPTTAGLLTIRSLKPRPSLPASAAFADGDYRPLPWSGDYTGLVGANGPLARAGIALAKAYELRLSGSFDTGRSWEAPVALAHLLISRGHELVADPAEAELILWATGALDLDLRLIGARYALLDKLERTEALFAAAPQARIAVLLPPDDERDAAWARLSELLRERLRRLDAQDMPAAAAQIELPTPRGSSEKLDSRVAASRLRPVWLFGPTAFIALAAAAFVFAGREPEIIAKPPQPAIAETGQPRPLPIEQAPPTQLLPPSAKPEPVPIIVEELRAPPGQSCRAVAFESAQPMRREVALDAGRTFATSRNDAGLCGLSFRPYDAKTVGIEVSANLRALTVSPSRPVGGGETLFFRDGVRQNVVYTVQVSILEGGTRKALEPFTHALVP